MTKDETGYKGWANYETWNIAQWLGNDEGLQAMVLDADDYAGLVDDLREWYGMTETPDRVAFNDSSVNISEINAMMQELVA